MRVGSLKSRRLPALAAGLLLHAASALADAEPSCLVNCARGMACTLSQAGSPTAPDATLGLTAEKLVRVNRCAARTVVDGAVVLRYRHQKRMFTTPSPIPARESLQVQLERNKPDPDCSLPDKVCLQKELAALKAAAGGHGIDGQASQPAGQGEPCRLGLPCGTIIPPAADWKFRLAQDDIQGSWHVQILRGQPPPGRPAQLQGQAAAGIVSADGSWFAPGITYAYALLTPDGSTRAAGEFTVQSSAQYATLRRLVDRRMEAGLTEASAWLDALAANQLDWDAIQRMNP